MNVSNEVLAVLMTVNLFILGGMFTFNMKVWAEISEVKKGKDEEISKLREQLSLKRDITHCSIEQSKCFTLFDKKVTALEKEDGEIWDAFNSHSHSGLPENSRVTRG
jgi:hypothetical protein